MDVEHPPDASPGAMPVFRDPGNTYVADGCLPLREAVAAREIEISAIARGHYPGRRLTGKALSGVSSVGYWDAHKQQHWGLSWHRNEGIEISYLERGALDFAVPGCEYRLKPGDIAITRPWQLHRVGGSQMGPNRLHWLILDVGVRSQKQAWKWPSWLVLSPNESIQLQANLAHTSEPVWKANAEMRRCFQLIAQTLEKDDFSWSTSRMAIRINDLFLSMLDVLRLPAIQPIELSTDSRESVRLFLDRLATDPESLAAPWTLQSMASECRLKTTQFVRYAKELTNLAPMHYVNYCRLEHASRLLKTKASMSITNVAFDCGFSSSQYFATLFKHRFGVMPKEFRNSAKDQC